MWLLILAWSMSGLGCKRGPAAAPLPAAPPTSQPFVQFGIVIKSDPASDLRPGVPNFVFTQRRVGDLGTDCSNIRVFLQLNGRQYGGIAVSPAVPEDAPVSLIERGDLFLYLARRTDDGYTFHIHLHNHVPVRLDAEGLTEPVCREVGEEHEQMLPHVFGPGRYELVLSDSKRGPKE